ncbi:hypothetical protein Q5692_18700 [Microcoleus sp. C2C3]|uniref:hypothetical protein n=1 Tax=unclassified Microcoleus TaxID=2642155 RepID=UPI002FD2A14D
MSNKPRNTSGKFAFKSEAPRRVRSVNLTDEDWKLLGDFGEAQGMTRNDYIEALLRKGIPDFGHPFIETDETEVKPYGADITQQPDSKVLPFMEMDKKDLAAEVLNQLRAVRRKSTASLADVEAILEMIEGKAQKGN